MTIKIAAYLTIENSTHTSHRHFTWTYLSLTLTHIQRSFTRLASLGQTRCSISNAI